MSKITKDKFLQYEKIRRSGQTNMFDIKRVIALSDDLTREEVLKIIKWYKVYAKGYLEGGEGK